MQFIAHILGALTAGLCAVLLLRAYGNVRARLLFWSGLCFTGFTVAQVLLLIDLMVFPHDTLYTVRLLIAAIALMALLYGLIFESD